MIDQWLKSLEAGDFKVNPIESNPPPELHLRGTDR
jgi:hypothetical protein